MSETDEQGGRQRTGFWITVILCLLVAYLLSTGPMAWLIQHGILPQGNPVIEIIYCPLHWLVFSSDACLDLYVRYLSLWGIPVG